MDYELSDEQAALVDATRRLLGVAATSESVRQRADLGGSSDAALWRRGAELGWPGLGIPEAAGGFGQGVADWALVSIELGRALAPTPFLHSVVVIDALAGTDGHADVVEGVIEGQASAGWAFGEAGRAFSPTAVQATARPCEAGFLLNGRKAHVVDASRAGHFLVDTVLGDGLARFLVPDGTPGLRVIPSAQIDLTREIADLELSDVEVSRRALVAEGDAALVGMERSCALAALLASAELVGVGEALLAMTVDYAGVRTQFDRPIGSFQAVKHLCAGMRTSVQAARAAVLYAAMALDAGTPDASRAVSVAKSFASDAIREVAGNALQIHGGIGFTWEHDLHFFIRRAEANALLFGDVEHHRELLCQSLEAVGAGMDHGH